MGRVHKKFTAVADGVRVTSTAKIDSGADVSLVKFDIGRKLGVDFETSPTVAIGGVGQQRLVGFQVPATVKIDGSSADLNLAVPVGVVNPKTGKFTRVQQKTNLIGHDFLQATGAKLDFSKHGDAAFVTGGDVQVDDVVLLRATEKENHALREWARQHVRPQRPRRGVKRKTNGNGK